jgi:hypothetical protein
MNTQDKEDLESILSYDLNATFVHNATIDKCCEELSKYAFTSFEYSILRKLRIKES